jgi:hypothetical protein
MFVAAGCEYCAGDVGDDVAGCGGVVLGVAEGWGDGTGDSAGEVLEEELRVVQGEWVSTDSKMGKSLMLVLKSAVSSKRKRESSFSLN